MEQQASRPQVTGWKRDLVIWIDHQIYALAKHWLVVFNAVDRALCPAAHPGPGLDGQRGSPLGRAIYIDLQARLPPTARALVFLFGPQAHLLAGRAVGAGLVSEQDNIFTRQGILGTPEIGFKLALCQRDMALYGGLFVAGLVFGLVRKRLRPLKLWIFGLCLLPMAVDGGTQLLILRESTWPLRVVTGGLIGVACCVAALSPPGKGVCRHPPTRPAHRLFPDVLSP